MMNSDVIEATIRTVTMDIFRGSNLVLDMEDPVPPEHIGYIVRSPTSTQWYATRPALGDCGPVFIRWYEIHPVMGEYADKVDVVLPISVVDASDALPEQSFVPIECGENGVKINGIPVSCSQETLDQIKNHGYTWIYVA